VDDPADNPPHVLPHNPRNILESNEDDNKASKFWATSQDIDADEDGKDEVEVVKRPAESAGAELS
jgi:hypothetical protein